MEHDLGRRAVLRLVSCLICKSKLKKLTSMLLIRRVKWRQKHIVTVRSLALLLTCHTKFGPTQICSGVHIFRKIWTPPGTYFTAKYVPDHLPDLCRKANYLLHTFSGCDLRVLIVTHCLSLLWLCFVWRRKFVLYKSLLTIF